MGCKGIEILRVRESLIGEELVIVVRLMLVLIHPNESASL